MKSRNKVVGVVAAVTLALAGGGIWWGVATNAQGNLNERYAQAVEVLTQDTVELATSTVSLETLAGELFEAGEVPSSVATAVEGTEVVLSKVEETGHLSFADALNPDNPGLYTDVSNVSAQVIVAQLAENDSSEAQSDEAQSDSQSGSESSVPLTTQLEELGYSLEAAQSEDEAQSGSAQSGDTAQSGSTSIFGPFIVTVPADPEVDYTKEQLNKIEELTSEVEAQTDTVINTGAEVVSEAFGVKLDAALETYTTASKKLDDTIAKAEALLKSSDGKVADNKTRDALVKAIDAAKKEAKAEAPENPVPSDLSKGTKSEATKALEAAMKAVNDSQAAKTKADEEAKAAQAQAAQNSAPSNGGYSEDYSNDYSDYSDYSGYNDYSGGNSGGGYSNNSGGGYQAPSQPAPAPSQPAPAPSQPAPSQPSEPGYWIPGSEWHCDGCSCWEVW
ncbi:hypothetical protein FYJ24_05225 [Actinomycetaceae bacterium WB03_NA08]|uniref:Colicin transporter n=1 Tax=Scrofimicrobium canadense TaxID=2652290 RepID=A0A6N7VR09_9ACTO|nr:hypothetical protein [Scrofimicrobium canadense]MSS84177.1 hypothetical protein [Scrofimicrobium canadense]